MEALEKAVILTTMEEVRDFLSITNESLLDKFDENVYEKVKELTSKNIDYEKCTEDILKLDSVDTIINKKEVLIEILKRHFI